MTQVPTTISLEGLEAKWDAAWAGQRTYRFDRTKERHDIFAIDTPPPTVSGSLHLGSAFGYIQTDAIARFHRMSGQEVFYPMGWDDNGLPTERRVQNYFGVRCEPSAPYDPKLNVVPATDGQPQLPISRRNFVELCQQLTAQDEQVFEHVWRMLGLSVDWTLTYATIGERSRRVSQLAFLRNLQRGEAYSSEAPTVWDVDFRTAVAQAEIEDRETSAAAYRVAFKRADDDTEVVIETTRPELLPSCVALVTHPDDERFTAFVGVEVTTPLFNVRVPVLAHPLADPEKGTGIAMICTFGDTTDVTWWRELDLPTRAVIQRDGKFASALPPWLEAQPDVWEELAGKTAAQARRRVAELLDEAGALVGPARQIVHPVNYYEKGDRPLEIVTSRQWYIRNGARDPEFRRALIDRGRAIAWHPEHMRFRYEHWVDGLNSDWLISRQRFFGVPFPVWYPLDANGEPRLDEPLLPNDSSLPVDPQGEPPPGYAESQRGQPGGFVGDPDVMDTWATSSLSPQIICGWAEDAALFAKAFPMDLRPQGPEIVRTWLFSTVLRSHFEHGVVPWSNTFINGWILDPDRKKMSKSRGKIVTPMSLVEQYGADGVRYWACRAAPGADTAIDEAQMKNGRRLAIKIANASKFALGLGSDVAALAQITEPVDRAMLAQLAEIIDEATASFEQYQYQQTLASVERFFWHFCDNYLELVKNRAYGEGQGAVSAQAALATGLSNLLRLFAPSLPFVTEEVWSWWQDGSIHRAPWPTSAELRDAAGGVDPQILDVAASVLSQVHKAKTSEKRSLRTEVDRLVVADHGARLDALRMAQEDIRAAAVVRELVFRDAPELEVSVEIAAVGD